jgi:hypothetical protein
MAPLFYLKIFGVIFALVGLVVLGRNPRDASGRLTRHGRWLMAVAIGGAAITGLTAFYEELNKQQADAVQREKSEDLLSSVERGVYSTADASLDLGYELDPSEAGLEGYKQKLESLLKEAQNSERQGHTSGLLQGCSLQRSPQTDLGIINCARAGTDQPSTYVGFFGFHPIDPGDGFEITGGKYIHFQPHSLLAGNYEDAIVSHLIKMTAVNVHFLGPPSTDFTVTLNELAHAGPTFFSYHNGKLILSSGSTPFASAPELRRRWTSGAAIPSIVDLLGTEALLRVIVSDYACVGVGEVDRCLHLKEKYQAALKPKCLTITFQHRRDIVFRSETADQGSNFLRIKFPAKLSDFPQNTNRQQCLTQYQQVDMPSP